MTRVAIILIIVLAAFLRLHDLRGLPPGLYRDEAFNGTDALHALSHGPEMFYAANNGREGLFINLQALSVTAFGPEPWALRLVSAIFGILTVPGIFFLARELFLGSEASRRNADAKHAATVIALLSAFFLATSFWHLTFSRQGLRAISAPFFMVWSFYLFLVGMRTRRLLPSAAGGALFGLGFHSYIAFRFAPLALLPVYLVYSKKAGRYLAIFTAAAAALILPLAAYFIGHPADFFFRIDQISVMSADHPLRAFAADLLRTALMFTVAGDADWRHNFAAKPELFLPVGIFFTLGLMLQIRTLLRLGAAGSASAAAWLVSVAIFTAIAGLHQKPWLAVSAAVMAVAALLVFLFAIASRRRIDFDAGVGMLSDTTYRQAFAALLTMAAVFILPAALADEGVPHALRSLAAAPAVFIIAGYGAYWAYETLSARERTVHLVLAGCLLAVTAAAAYDTYFLRWGPSSRTASAFGADAARAGSRLAAMPAEPVKHVVAYGCLSTACLAETAQSVMFLTDTASAEKQARKGIRYLLPSEASLLPPDAVIIPLGKHEDFGEAPLD